jgi:hypothetical protein
MSRLSRARHVDRGTEERVMSALDHDDGRLQAHIDGEVLERPRMGDQGRALASLTGNGV